MVAIIIFRVDKYKQLNVICDNRVMKQKSPVGIWLSLLMLTLGINQTYGSAIAKTGLFV